jgi:hypothetical protein
MKKNLTALFSLGEQMGKKLQYYKALDGRCSCGYIHQSKCSTSSKRYAYTITDTRQVSKLFICQAS